MTQATFSRRPFSIVTAEAFRHGSARGNGSVCREVSRKIVAAIARDPRIVQVPVGDNRWPLRVGFRSELSLVTARTGALVDRG